MASATSGRLCHNPLEYTGYLNPKRCKIMASRAIIMDIGPLFFIFWVFR